MGLKEGTTLPSFPIIVRNSGKRLLCLYARRAPMRILDIFDPRTLFSGHSARRA
jgi:hypothetical protein